MAAKKKPTAKKKPEAQKIKAWSFSRYSVYQSCPLKAKLKFIDRIPEPGNDAMKRGADIHDMAESFIKGTLKKLPIELKLFGDDLRRLKKQYAKSINGMVVEDTWAFTKSWDQTVWNDWIKCWVRIKLDCAETDPEDDEVLIIRDWKTGKFWDSKNEEYIEQLELYALAALLLHDHIMVVKPKLVYLDQGIEFPEEDSKQEELLTFNRQDIPRLKKAWEKRTRAMLNDTIFAPRPHQWCSTCFYRKSNTENNGTGRQLCKY